MNCFLFLRRFLRINERVKRLVATILCVSLVMVDTLPYYAEGLFGDVANDAVTDFADTLVSSISSAEEENEIVDEDIDGEMLFGADPVPPDGYFYLTYTYATRSEATPSEFIDVTKEVLVKASDSVTFPIVIDFADAPLGKRHFIQWREDTSLMVAATVLNGGTLPGSKTQSFYNSFIDKGYTGANAYKRRKNFEPIYYTYATDENDLTILTPTIDDYYGIDISELPDEVKNIDEKYAIYFYYDKEILGQEISSNPIVATYDTGITFPTIDTSLIKPGYTFEGWVRDDITIGSGGTLSVGQSKICTGVGTDKYVIFEAKMTEPNLYTVHFDIEEEYYDDVIPPITNATSSVIKFPSFPNKLRGVEIASWKSSDGVYSYAPGAEVNFSALNWTNTNDYYFTPVYEVKDINVHFKNELPPYIPGTIPASRSDIVVRVNQSNPNEYQQYIIEGYKHEGWGLSSDGEIAIEVDEDNIEPLRFLKAGQLSYDMYPIFLPDGERPEPIPEEPKKRRYSGGGGSSGGGVYYSGGASSGIFEFDPLLNKFKCYVFDKNNNKQYIVNDWFKIVDKKDGRAYWYLTDATGCMVTGWTLCDGVFYYFSESVSDYGMMANGTYNINGKEYVFTSDGQYVGDPNLIPKVYNIVTRNIVANMSDTEVSAFNDTEVFAFADTEPTRPYIEYFDKDNNYIGSDEEVYYNHYKQRFEFFLDSHSSTTENYIFEGWEVINSSQVNPKLYTADMKVGTNKSWSFRAKYRPVAYTVIYFGKETGLSYKIDNVDVSTLSVVTNYTIANKTPTKLGYNCIGFTDVLPANTVKYHIGETIAIHQDINLYPVWEKKSNTKYISDLKLTYCGDEDGGIKKAQKKLTDAGYTIVKRNNDPADLNEHAGGKYIYLGYKTTTDPSQAIRSIGASTIRPVGGPDSEMKIAEINYNIVKTLDGSKNLDLNMGAGGSYIYLYYSKDLAAGTPITELTVEYSPRTEKDENYFLNSGWFPVKDINEYIDDYKIHPIIDFNDGVDIDKHPYSHYLYMKFRSEGDIINPDPYMDYKYVKANNWMAKVPGNRLITHINIPGTHDAGTADIAKLKRLFGQCQQLQIDEQLEAGVRFLDCRLGANGNVLMFFHGDNDGKLGWLKQCYCYNSRGGYLRYYMALEWCINFVTANPTETILMRIDRETGDSGLCTKLVNKVLAKYKNTGRVYLSDDDRIPMLSEVRGKVVIIDRGVGGINGAISLSTTQEEDNYGFTGYDKIVKLSKFIPENCKTEIDKLKKDDYYLIHTSCCGYNGKGTIPLPIVHAGWVVPWFLGRALTGYLVTGNDGFGAVVRDEFLIENPNYIEKFLEEHHGGTTERFYYESPKLIPGIYYGTVAMDFVTQEMAEKVYRSNFKY